MEISEVAEILGACHFLKVPKHIIITDEPVYTKDKQTFFRGLQPVHRGDVIFLTRDADHTTPIHEAIHAQTGLGEPGTEFLTSVILRKNKLLANFPEIRAMLKRRRIRYRKVDSSKEFPMAHGEFRDRVEHYVLED